jgi:hypothetical protein
MCACVCVCVCVQRLAQVAASVPVVTQQQLFGIAAEYGIEKACDHFLSLYPHALASEDSEDMDALGWEGAWEEEEEAPLLGAS